MMIEQLIYNFYVSEHLSNNITHYTACERDNWRDNFLLPTMFEHITRRLLSHPCWDES